MKRFKVGKWGQIHLLGEEKSVTSKRWTVRSFFFLLVALMIVIVFVITA